MRHYQVIIIGGGPAGAACAWRLIQDGIDCLILDKQSFPRPKTCAGWITPRVLRDLDFNPSEYPYDLTLFQRIYINGFPILRPGKQYAIRRVEFDNWLLERSGAPVIQHHVKEISKSEKGYMVDGEYSAEYLIGAGGTHCPVYHTFFSNDQPRTGAQIVALEEEFSTEWKDGGCRLWFFENGFPGYAWYVPKAGGYLNIGVGGNALLLKQQGRSIQDQWDYLVQKLQDLGLVSQKEFQPEGCVYYLRGKQDPSQVGNAILIGDAAGLATLDMGEGIGPAVRSGLLAAESILGISEYSLAAIPKCSLIPKIFQWAVNYSKI